MFGEHFLKLAALIILYLGQHNIGPKKPPTLLNEALLSHRPLVFAHRGGALENFENSLSSFVNAHLLGADGIELDVRKTADDVLVVIHDETLTRITGQPDSVDGIIYDHIAPYLNTIHSDYGGVYEGDNMSLEKPPTLEQVFEFLSHTEMFVSIDMKIGGQEDSEHVLRMAKDFGILGRVLFNTSADHHDLSMAIGEKINFINSSSHLPEVYQSIMTGHFAMNPEYEFDVFNTTYNFKTLQLSPYYNQIVVPPSPPHPAMTLGDVLSLLEDHEKEVGVINRIFKKKRVPVMYYLANFDEDYKKAIYLGANVIMTDRPADLITYLELTKNSKRHHHSHESREDDNEEDSREDMDLVRNKIADVIRKDEFPHK